MFIGAFIYYWIPGYFFQALSVFNWPTWFAPKNLNLAIVSGSKLGLGFNPVTTFDWVVASQSFDILSTPFFSTAHLFFGSILGGLAILYVYYKNIKWTGYLPINSSGAFANDGKAFDIKRVVVGNRLIEDKYQQYSPPFYSAGHLVSTAATFVFYPVYVIYILVNQWMTIKGAFIELYQSLSRGKEKPEAMDVFNRNMARHLRSTELVVLADISCYHGHVNSVCSSISSADSMVGNICTFRYKSCVYDCMFHSYCHYRNCFCTSNYCGALHRIFASR